ncbi:UDP-N-acetylmuramoyl-tripeptide--D-alanyl-D-alanine ligase [Eubacterium ruminantium]|uniref:UDP-N-acetylmuramoyl-tripeptide--D-alanyl-D-alanine ligase n=1 Tax=Eubacterium ruminantium TaxID=42322 RepID=A0A1T4K0I5_9FIRM|nr:UDP-N-acetylmuramoyl-tripeptide--D-alanyl-D-alanine ligase [Eubacterium ruminantium]SCW28696.1 UDP-N-acetylmuramoyl-tripeptide--D-alanyl-D-alanine ligase [Eubacterium ruminantium]SDM10938.1 UDP-N-acetylmuramoyl-tripeptide--D-alanyl-D-alanine ligase [Eubacterium ruminantium]SJZ35923.1 UDP-N-acetylmuramoyl-tripeptide--D-alanyl-D-alanine ligase [Eubacterium ruminantium]
MKNMTVEEILKAVNGRLLGAEEGSSEYKDILAISVDDISMNSREAGERDIFVPLVGTNVDAHRFIDGALEKANVTFTDRELSTYIPGKAYIKVENTIKALQMLGGYIRKKYDKTVIAVTGSVGKTTTREMITAALSAENKVYHTEKNFNSETGAPITLFKMLDNPSDLAVLELGISDFGEMDDLAEIALPDIAVVTVIGDAHQQFFKTRENTRTEKLKIASRMDNDGVIFLNADDPLLLDVKGKMPVKQIYYGTTEDAEIRAVDITQTKAGTSFTYIHGDKKVPIKIPVFGKHNVIDATVAMGLADHLGFDLSKAAESLSKFEGQRQRVVKAKTGFTIIDDTYNASPDSMKAALEVLKNHETSGRRVAVLGDMFELGDNTAELHAGVGRFIVNNNIDILVTVGDLSKNIANAASEDKNIEIHCLKTIEEAIEYLQNNLFDGDTVLLKASNGMHFKDIVKEIEE